MLSTMMDIHILAKIPALALIMLAETWSFIPPDNPQPKEEDRQKYGAEDIITRVAGWCPIIGTSICFVIHLCEVAGILAQQYPSELSRAVLAALFKRPAAVENLAVSRTFALGFMLLVGGGAVRKLCYATLGKFFTFQLAVLKDHKLVTWGPYAVVRHPSYSGFILVEAGLLLVQLCPGSYVWESGMLETRWKAALWALWALWIVYLPIVAVKRVAQEDEVLRKEFGQEWDEWAKRTPYRLVPCVY